ncbi:Type II DNA topoisomerase VI subunit A [Wickerhamomyces ciferrii]|uniref:DNA topoisomerase (ATP-hydrolyzing) n=1 Tax=Wickerhamomyces ciferrii (strain ATCC 14091 / BCRC 22168 / CBS 111 / JCM 3599 / NBRC 0793 / NRRL Y-1031 F-60-10) TaxID=1206466 RepID=K0KNX4_WICCF|nr:Type II DNA topoisomerase VI subunit A [Wickerhamomyces ciferrii]CCH42798.1 Type II DNA topoisomerase VI subunit A [Wickerhamomyces ciferrii]
MKNIYNSFNNNSKQRTVHFHPDVSTQILNKRSPLEKLELIQNTITNGILANNSIILNIKPENKIGNNNNNNSKSIFKLPSNNLNESRQFAMCLKLISMLIENLKNKKITTKRDLYYQDVSLFENQSNVDKLINSICKSLGFNNLEIGAVAAQKGLCFGNIDIIDISNNDMKSFNIKDGCFLIPRINSNFKIIIKHPIDYILIVEKDSIFQLICDPLKMSNNLIITGKGFPDNNTKMFLNLLSKQYPQIPIYGFADIDPHGLNIMKQYKDGGDLNNCFMVHEMDQFHCQNLKLLDLLSNLHFLKTFDCLDFSLIDYQISFKLIESEFDDNDNNSIENEKFRNQLQRTMFFGKKAEIDLIKSNDDNKSNNKTDLIQFIDERIKISNGYEKN